MFCFGFRGERDESAAYLSLPPNLLWNQGAIPKSWSTKDKSRTSTPSGLGSSALTKRLSASPRERQREKQFFALSFFRCLMTRCQYLDKVCCATKVSLERRHPAEAWRLQCLPRRHQRRPRFARRQSGGDKGELDSSRVAQ